MTDEEFEKIALLIKAAYPDANVFPDKYAMRLWFQMLGDLDYKLLENSVIEHISMSPFAPKISDLRNRCAVRQIEIPDWGEAWGKVHKAIQRYGAYREDEALNSLDEITREAVRRFGFKDLCYSDFKNMETDRAQFRDIYNAVAAQRKEETRIPPAALEEKKRLKQEYIGEEKKEPPLLLDNRTEIERAMARRSKPEYVDNLLSKLKKSLFTEGN